MGAWGSGIFEDDMALDTVAEIEGSADPRAFFRSSFETAIGASDYLDYDDGYKAIVSAAYVDSILNGTRYGEDGVDVFVEEHANLKVDDLKADAVAALQRVIGEASELNELWSETDGDLTWKNNIEALIKRLR